MLKSCEPLQPTDGRIEGQMDDREGWSVLRAGPPFDVGIRELRMFLGDKESGPIVWLLHFPRFEFPPDMPRPESIEAPTHRHRSPTWRMSLGDQPRQTLIDHRWVGKNDWYLLDANQVYSEQVGVDGAKNVLVFADRRGIPSMYKDTEALDAQALVDVDARVYGTSVMVCLPSTPATRTRSAGSRSRPGKRSSRADVPEVR